MNPQKNPSAHLAIDLGADSGRVVVGTLRDGRMTMHVAHRFANGPQQIDGTLRWNVTALWQGIREGIRLARQQTNVPIASIGVDTWGVDYVLVDVHGDMLEAAWHYRDARTTGIPAHVAQIVSEAEQFQRTGVRGMIFNTVYQLVAHQQRDPALLQRAHRLLHIPDYLGFLLSGVMANEWTIAGTGGLTRAGKPQWDTELIQRLGLPLHLFGPIVPAGTPLAPMRAALAAELGFKDHIPLIIAPGGHDTASAVAAMPTSDANAAFLSCGTWSLLGLLTDQPCTGADALQREISNEVAVDGRVRLLANIMGLWVWQETRRDLIAEGTTLEHAQLATLAAQAAPAAVAIDINAAILLPPSKPGDRMIDRVRLLAQQAGIPAHDPGDLFRRIVEGLVAAYAKTVQSLQVVTGRRISAISVMGGGSHNQLLCQLTANATGVTVLAGPDEGTALGNLLVQVRGLGWCDTAGMGTISAASCSPVVYTPKSASGSM